MPVFRSLITQRSRRFNIENRLFVNGLVLLVNGTSQFNNYTNIEGRVFGLDHKLIEAISSRASGYDLLSNEDIKRALDILYKEHGPREATLVGNYRILGKLSASRLFDAYEAENVNFAQKVRLKRYQLPINSSTDDIKRLQRNAAIITKMGPHPNILTTYDFVPDPEEYDVFYEVTELPDGDRLDEMIAQIRNKMPLERQLQIIEQICLGLSYAHKKSVVHRSLSPDVIYVLNNGMIKLGDFDFAKSAVAETISIRKNEGIDKDTAFSAPELLFDLSLAYPGSDIFSLGIIWFYLASLPDKNPQLSIAAVDKLDLPNIARRLIKKMTAISPENRTKDITEVLGIIKKLKE